MKLNTNFQGFAVEKKQSKILANCATFICTAALSFNVIAEDTEVKQFDIPAQSLQSALIQFSETADMQMSYPAELAEGVKTQGVTGDYTSEQALKKLLEGSGLEPKVINKTVTIKQPDSSALTMENLLAAADSNDYPVRAVASSDDGPVEQEDMTVSGTEMSPYVKSSSTAGTKISIENVRVPQSIQVITDTAFKDQGAKSIGDIMKQIPSASVFGSRYSRFPGVSIRGFNTEQTRNGIRQLFFGDTDFSSLSHIQNVEVLKGPGSSTFGQGGDGGGIINVITKRPYDILGVEVSFTQGGWTGFDGHITSGQFDINSPLTSDGALKVRFTGEIEGTDSFIDHQELNRENFGLALSYDDGGPVRGFINAEYQHRQSLPNPGLPAIGTVQSSAGVGNVSRDTYLGEPAQDSLEMYGPLVQAWLDIDVAKDWTVSPRFQYHEFGGSQSQMFLGTATPNTATQQLNVVRFGREDFVERDRTFVGQIDITGKLETGPLQHQVYLGGDYTNHHTNGEQNPRLGIPSINALDPVYMKTPLTIGTANPSFAANWEVGAVAFQDSIAITRYFDLLGSVRHSRVTGKRRTMNNTITETDTDITTYQLGGTIHATDNIHLFAGYGEGFNVNSAVGFGGAGGKPFKLGESNQIEAGVKVNFPWGLTGTASYFDITRTNVSTPDRNNPGFQVQTGEIRSQGAELELAYQVNEQWYVQGGYAFTDAKIIKSNAGDVGNRFQNIPEHQANLWTHYKFNSGLLKNLTLSTGMNFTGDRPLDNASTVKLTNYTTWDIGASYTYKNAKVEVFANNILDKRYFTAADFGTTVFAGDPRSVMGRISYKY